jgi:hypothetical protein
MQNKANFRKVKLNVNKVLTKDYEKKDTWSIRKTKPIQSQSKPIKANSKPIQANIMPKQSQFKPKQTQCLPATPLEGLPATPLEGLSAISVADQSQYMKITGRHDPFVYNTEIDEIDKTNCILGHNLVIISKYSRSNKMQLSEDCCPNFNEGVNLCTETK